MNPNFYRSSLRSNPAPRGKINALLICLIAVVLWGIAYPQVAHAEWSYLDSWKAHPQYKGPVPKKSDVIFSTRFKRDEAPGIARAYGATRIEWVYSSDAEYIKKLRDVAPWFGGTLSSTIPLKDGEGIARDIEGNPIVAPWMKSWGAKWITTTDPRTRVQLTSLAKAYINAGASSIQVDDPLLQFTSRSWGGDFSSSSIEGFRKFLRTYPDRTQLTAAGLDNPNLDYRKYLAEKHGIRTAKEYSKRQRNLPSTPIWHAYLKQSVISHYAELRKTLDTVAGKRVPMSMNLSLTGPNEKHDQFELVPFADYAMVETKIDDHDVLSLQVATYRALGMGYVPSILPKSKNENRAAIAMFYAMGAQPLVPWDVYINQGPDKAPARFFGNPEEYADLYQFVRKHAESFDDFESLPVVGILAPVGSYRLKETLALVKRLNQMNVPFALIPLWPDSAENASTINRLAYLRSIVSVNHSIELGEKNIRAIAKSNTKVMNANDLSDESLRELSPIINPSKNGFSPVIIRKRITDKSTVVVHRVQKSSGGTFDYANCDKTISIKRRYFDNRRAVGVFLLGHKGRVPISFSQNASALTMKLPACKEHATVMVNLK